MQLVHIRCYQIFFARIVLINVAKVNVELPNSAMKLFALKYPSNLKVYISYNSIVSGVALVALLSKLTASFHFFFTTSR